MAVHVTHGLRDYARDYGIGDYGGLRRGITATVYQILEIPIGLAGGYTSSAASTVNRSPIAPRIERIVSNELR